MDEPREMGWQKQLMDRHANRKEIEWVPWENRPSESGIEILGDKDGVTFILTLAGLGEMVIHCSANWKAPAGRLQPETVSLCPLRP